MKILFPLFLVVVAVLVFYFLTSPLLEEVNVLGAEIATKSKALDNARDLIKIRDVKNTELNNYPKDIKARLEKLLPDHIDNVRLIIDLIKLARDNHGLELQNPQIEGSPIQKGVGGPDLNKYDSVQLSFTVTAKYDVFQRFMADLEKSLRLLDVTSIKFSAADKDEYDFTVSVKTYWLK